MLRLLSPIALVCLMSACTQGDDTAMATEDDTSMDMRATGGDMPGAADLPAHAETSFADVLTARTESIDDVTFTAGTPAADTLTGTGTYQGAAAVEMAADGRTSDVDFAAFGVMTAEVDFARSRISAQATDFYQLDTDALNATGDVVNAGAIEGRISVDGPILRGATANGSGLIMGALTDLDGESVATTGVASARFGNAGGALLVIEKAVPTDLDDPVTRISLTGVRD